MQYATKGGRKIVQAGAGSCVFPLPLIIDASSRECGQSLNSRLP